MSDKPVIFISHSKKDKSLVLELKQMMLKHWLDFVEVIQSNSNGKYIKYTVQSKTYIVAPSNLQMEFFISSEAHAIPTGFYWQDLVLKKISEAVAFVPVITPNSISSRWVWFEIGYYWAKSAGRNIFPTYALIDEIPSPLNTLQAKDMANTEELSAWSHDILLHAFNLYAQNTLSITSE